MLAGKRAGALKPAEYPGVRRSQLLVQVYDAGLAKPLLVSILMPVPGRFDAGKGASFGNMNSCESYDDLRNT